VRPSVLRSVAALAASIALLSLFAPPAGAEPGGAPVSRPPASLAALGDSITRGFHARALLTDSVRSSWATGVDEGVDSLARRLRAVAPVIDANVANLARAGATMAELDGQAAAAVAMGAEAVTVLMGANDACAGDVAAMTPVDVFRIQFEAAMATLSEGLPDSTVLVLSIPDLYQLWEAGRSSATTRATWRVLGICPSMLARPTSTADGDVARRASVRQRVQDYNAVLAAVCDAHARCHHDGGAGFTTRFEQQHLSRVDWFHPNRAGQALAAAVAWEAFADVLVPAGDPATTG
jgi:hypothetical protein